MVPWSHSLQCSQPLRVKAFVGAAAAGGNGYKPPPLVSLRRSPGHPGRSAHGSRVSRNAQTDAAGQGPTRVPGVSGKLERRVIRGSKLGAGNSERCVVSKTIYLYWNKEINKEKRMIWNPGNRRRNTGQR